MGQMVIVKEIIRSYYTCSDAVRMDIDDAISTLSKRGILDEKELLVIHLTKEQHTKADINEVAGIPSSSVGRVLDRACGKIAEYLGEEYQDDKLLHMVEEKLGRPLTDKEIDFCLYRMRNLRSDGAARLNIFNFEIRDGKFTERREDKE